MRQNPFLALLPIERAERQMPELKRPLSDAEALVEAQRCLFCYDAPCIQACPTAIDIPQFIKQIATGNVRGAARTIFASNILGMSCARVCPVEVLCEGSCVYELWHKPPIQIGKLQRHATDLAYERNEQFFHAGAPSGYRAALVGAGPASLACAHELTRLGHEAVVLEGRMLPGGLNTTGVAPYKLYSEDSIDEVAYVQQIGFEIRTGVAVGTDVSFAELEREFDAVFLGVGLGEDGRLAAHGAELEGVRGAVEWIEEMKNSERFSLPEVRRAVVIGGGNTAADVVRELRKLGVPDVTLAYRRGEEHCSAYRHERDWAAREGVKFCFWAQPVGFKGEGRLEGVRFVEAEGGTHPGTESVLPADLCVLAIGQGKLSELLGQVPDLKLERGRVLVDPRTGQTSNPAYFSGGDCANGGKEVVNAAAEGKRAARGMDAFLRGRRPKRVGLEARAAL
jgi:dihydropyrimidine dehydrogenase (NAD+) subunit PreT